MHRLRILRTLFWIALVFALSKALLLPPKSLRLFHWDKAEHFMAFYVLALLAAAAWPRRALLEIALALSLVAAGIEVAQALPFISRDSEFWDWFAGTLGIAAALLPIAAAAWRSPRYSTNNSWPNRSG